MYALMYFKGTLSMVRFITYITAKRPFPATQTLMCLQINLPTEGFITYIAEKWKLPTMHTLMHL
jgi:hypothetical protein